MTKCVIFTFSSFWATFLGAGKPITSQQIVYLKARLEYKSKLKLLRKNGTTWSEKVGAPQKNRINMEFGGGSGGQLVNLGPPLVNLGAPRFLRERPVFFGSAPFSSGAPRFLRERPVFLGHCGPKV